MYRYYVYRSYPLTSIHFTIDTALYVLSFIFIFQIPVTDDYSFTNTSISSEVTQNFDNGAFYTSTEMIQVLLTVLYVLICFDET